MEKKIIFKENVPLKSFSNFKIGGEARYFFKAKSVKELSGAIRKANEAGVPVFILGGGTNLLISDNGFNGLVVKPEIDFIRAEGTDIFAGAGVSMDKLLDFAAENNLSGLEWAGGLPGTLGGAIRGNAGCFGGEIKDLVSMVHSLDCGTYEILGRDNAECVFGYRNSIFKKGPKEIILEAVLSLVPGEKEKISALVNEKIEYRKARQPLNLPNIGSIFKNIPTDKFRKGLTEELKTHVKNDPLPLIPAAVLISQSGLKGKKVGGAQVSERHANFIVNTGGATAKDVLVLIDLIKEEVGAKFGVILEPEVEFVGF